MNIASPLEISLGHSDVGCVVSSICHKMLSNKIYKPDKIYSLSEFQLELKMILKTLLDEIRSGNCEEEIESYFFLKQLKDKNPAQYEKVLKWNHLEDVA
ncbi:hypothetical protein [Caedibacter taeniospiralis]|uniref:Uncharacterized protein n=1 Tax=Caedibacter taeniospiralis TaxID=28907 RepID=Q6TFE3_CAETA|nr:hypothetical protein [Caedibacter taeniospiralis]AAR87116.1 hypothetical protein [Caedibacter taeniospiralis]